MASACVNSVGVSPENFQFGWLSPRISSTSTDHPDPNEIQDIPASEFEFRLEDYPVAMLTADELFSDGKLMPLHFPTVKPPPLQQNNPSLNAKITATMEISGSDHYLFSPKAPRCSSRWRELLGLKKCSPQNTNNNNNNQQQPPSKADSQSDKISLLSNNNNPKSLKHFLYRSSKSSIDSSLSLPLLKTTDSESFSLSSTSSRLSLSSSSSSQEHDDLPRLSLDSSDKPTPNPFAPSRNMRMIKPRPGSDRMGRSPIRRDTTTIRGVSVDSPRMNSSGKVVFQSLGRSSSSPSSFNGGPRYNKQRAGMERSYSANVRITPVLNVPVCSLRGSSKSGSVFGFGQLFSSSPQKNPNGLGNNNKSHLHVNCNRNKTMDRNH